MDNNYEKEMFNHLVNIMAKLDAIEEEHKKDRKEIKALNSEIISLRKENDGLKDKIAILQGENAALLDRCSRLEKENRLLRDDNERIFILSLLYKKAGSRDHTTSITASCFCCVAFTWVLLPLQPPYSS